MKISKKKIQEIIDDDGNIIGLDDLPKTGGEKESEANHTTDYNVNVHGQNFKNDFLGRFGFYFYEEEQEQPPVVTALMDLMGSEEIAWKIMHTIKPFLEDTLDSMQVGEGIVSESKVVEDKITDKKTDNTIVKKDKKKDMAQRVERVADLLAKLPASDLDKLMNLLEAKKKK